MWECLIKALDDETIFNISKQRFFIKSENQDTNESQEGLLQSFFFFLQL